MFWHTSVGNCQDLPTSETLVACDGLQLLTRDRNPTKRGSIESDLRPLNIGPSYARKKAASREHWRSIVDTATPNKSILIEARLSAAV